MSEKLWQEVGGRSKNEEPIFLPTTKILQVILSTTIQVLRSRAMQIFKSEF
jgi:hypothetical protein